MRDTTAAAVVVPVYNRRLKLIKTLESVGAQSKAPALVVVVDDGSSDGSGDAAERWLAENASFDWKVVRQKNAGVSAARNAGFAEIGNLPFICFLDSDDLWPSEFLEEGLRAFGSDKDIVASVADFTKVVNGRESRLDRNHFSENPILWILIRSGEGLLSCSILRTDAVRASGLFVRGMRASEDVDFLIRLFMLGRVAPSQSRPVRIVKGTPLEATEPPNLGHAFQDMPYLWASYRESVLPRLPAAFFETNERVIRISMTYKWARAAFHCRNAFHIRRAVVSLAYALRWETEWTRRAELIGAFLCGEKIPNTFAIGDDKLIASGNR